MNRAGTGTAGRTARVAGRARTALAGARDPIVVILLLIAFFSTVSGKPLDGLLMLLVALGLALDAGAAPAAQDDALLAGDQVTSPPPGPPPDPPAGPAALSLAGARAATAGHRRTLILVVAAAGGLLYAAVVGSFTRYSWPATVAIVALGALVLIGNWPGPLRERADPGPLPLPGVALWGGVLVAGGLWELSALLQQPSLTASSYTHPTISTLTDPLLASHLGRSAALAAWLVIGWLLVER